MKRSIEFLMGERNALLRVSRGLYAVAAKRTAHGDAYVATWLRDMAKDCADQANTLREKIAARYRASQELDR